MANIGQKTVEVVGCPYNDCDGTDIEIVSGISECAFTIPLDCNKVSISCKCKKCGNTFILHYHFE